MPRIAYLVSSATEITMADGTTHPTGYFAEEALKPYESFSAAGFEVVVITPDGKPPSADPYGLSWFFHYPDEDKDYLNSVVRTFAHDVDDIRFTLHHNTELHFSLPEILPLVNHVKDTARAIGRWLEVPEELLMRHPFPGPGLLVRITGEVTRERLHTAREIDRIYIEELRAADLYDYVWQAGAVAADLMVTTTKGDTRGEGFTLIVWAVHSVDGFTATWVYFEEEFLRRLSKRFTNEMPGVGMVVMRISDKPPSTIEVG
jgi:GMP synthase (glutamine-hydrolysing) B subunit